MVAFTCQRIVSDCTRGFTSKSDRWKIRSRDCISLQCGACRILDLDSNARIVFQSVALNQRTGCALNADSRMLAFFQDILFDDGHLVAGDQYPIAIVALQAISLYCGTCTVFDGNHASLGSLRQADTFHLSTFSVVCHSGSNGVLQLVRHIHVSRLIPYHGFSLIKICPLFSRLSADVGQLVRQTVSLVLSLRNDLGFHSTCTGLEFNHRRRATIVTKVVVFHHDSFCCPIDQKHGTIVAFQPTLGYRSCCLMLKGNRRHLVATQLAAAYVSCGISTHQDTTAIVGIESAV
mmetsp:Transcript_27806/g.60575  ORF Transcript_27806/g.60575 Transcript_27806/m.60575 type:complete len:291 (-) Transcript_27806:79-951(-)